MGIDILGIDIMGVDILGIDIVALPGFKTFYMLNSTEHEIYPAHWHFNIY